MHPHSPPAVTTARQQVRLGHTEAAIEGLYRYLVDRPGDVAALALLGRTLARTGRGGEAEAAFRQALSIAPASVTCRYGLAWVLARKLQRPLEAIEQLTAALGTRPAFKPAVQLLLEILRSSGQAPAFERSIDNALAASPDDPRLQLMKAQWHVESGTGAHAVPLLRRLAASQPNSAHTWLWLMREAERRRAWEEALSIADEAVQSCPDVDWISHRRLLMLSAAGREESLRAAAAGLPPPVRDGAQFMAWLSVLRNVELAEVAWNALPDPVEVARSGLEAALLVAELARDMGELPTAVTALRTAASEPRAPATLLRKLFDTALAAGDLDTVEWSASRLHRKDARTHGGLEMFLLHEARIHKDSMDGVRAVFAAGTGRLEAVAEILLRDPGSLPTALTWLQLYRAQPAQRRPSGPPSSAIPKSLHYVEAFDPGWEPLHGDFRRIDLKKEAPRLIEESGVFTPTRLRMISRQAYAAKVDLLRWAALWQTGGWWAAHGVNTRAAFSNLAPGDSDLSIALNDGGYPGLATIGAAPGHPAIRMAIEVAATVLDEPAPRENASQVATGMPSIALGVACAGARAMRRGLPFKANVLGPIQRDRLLGLTWPT